VRIATDASLRARLSAAGRARAGGFSVEAAARRFWAGIERAAAEGPSGSPSPVHVGPDRSFRGCCRYFLQVPAPATLELSGQAAWRANWRVAVGVGAPGQPAARTGQTIAGTALDLQVRVPVAPASVALSVTVDAGGAADLAHLTRLALVLDDGVALDVLPALVAGAHEETLEEGLARAVVQLRGLADRGIRRLALYGAGSHTVDLIGRLAHEPARVVAVIDDAPGEPVFAGVPRVTPAAWATLDADAVVLSSRTFEPLLAARAVRWLPTGVPLVRLYTEDRRS
jgi:hypothetical protein